MLRTYFSHVFQVEKTQLTWIGVETFWKLIRLGDETFEIVEFIEL